MIIGITGSFGTGKSTVARMFKELGADLIDADVIAHRTIRPGTAAYELIISCFGKSILSKTSYKISRPKLGKIVFDNKKLLAKLSNIVHPGVIKAIKDRVNQSQSRLIVIDAPLLIEAGLAEMVDKLIVVKTRRDTQIKRIMKKNSMSRAQVIKRIKTQMPLSKKIELADFVVDNDGSKTQTRKQVMSIYRQIHVVANTKALRKRKICNGVKKGEG